ncbi:MAG: Mu transposase C-terminal domain-containing protein [Candidimonas sp.]
MSELETRRVLRGRVAFKGRRYFSRRLRVYNRASVLIEKTDSDESILVYITPGFLICRASLIGGKA